MATKKTDGEATVTIPALDLRNITLKIAGDTPLICHAWSKKAKLEILYSQQKKAPKERESRRPAVEFADSLYWLTEKPNFDDVTDEEAQKILSKVIPKSKFGFPTLAFKAAALEGAFQQGLLAQRAGSSKLAKTTARGAIRVLGEFAEIKGIPTLREDVGRIGISQTNLVYRAEFKSWSTELNIQYNAGAISAEQIATIFNVGGFANGVGDWRQAKDGSFGSFHVE